MGWGEVKKDATSISQRIVAKSELDRAARALADTVEAYYQDLTTEAQVQMYEALAAFRRAEAAL